MVHETSMRRASAVRWAVVWRRVVRFSDSGWRRKQTPMAILAHGPLLLSSPTAIPQDFCADGANQPIPLWGC